MDPLKVDSVEFYAKQNAIEHHTEEYDLINVDPPSPILRRGCNFVFAIRFDREYDEEGDDIRVDLGFGETPNVVKGTRAILPVKKKQLDIAPHLWSLCVLSHEGNTVQLQIHIPESAQVGIWKCNIQTNIAGKREQKNNFMCEEDIYILFNPWCPEDSVYMENEEERNEYILNETGKIWCGTFKKPEAKPWIFGQFEDICLPAAMLLLEKSGLQASERGSPVLVSRAISAVINSVDDGGLLEGRWDGEYGDGTSPHAWTGSPAIMDQYLRGDATPVKYGQCWVYSAATVTVCRALGIPCRSTTNYVSAHDTNRSLTVDKYFDKSGNKIENGPDGTCKDSCWNFHVWNDVWMTRPDMPPGYGGWQIIDATPQETSEGVFRCGPASVAAVKKGEVGYLYDTPFVFSEVNADVLHFQEDDESDWGFKRMSINKFHVGRKIITKALGPTNDKDDSDMLDVTRVFKNKENTEAERLAVYNAVRGVPNAQQFYELPDKEHEDVLFDLEDIDEIDFGEAFDVVVKIENKSPEVRHISAMLSATSIFYTGTAAKSIKKSQGTFTVRPGQREVLKLKILPQDYMEQLVDHGLIKIYAIANVNETKQTWSEEDDFTMTKPIMTITVSGLCRIEEDCNVSFSFKNPLNMALTECSYTVEGPGLKRAKTIKLPNIQPNEIVNIDRVFKARKPGVKKIVATFTSKQVQGITGSTTVTMTK